MATLVVQPSAKDTRLVQSNPTTNYGTEGDIVISDYTSAHRVLIEFSLTDLPAGAIISSAILELYYSSEEYTDPVGKVVWAYKLTRPDWIELEATWNIYKTGNNWTTAGGDYVTSSPAGASTTYPASYGWMEWSVLAIVQDAFDAGVAAELLMKFETEGLGSGYSRPHWRSRDYAVDTSLRPKLTIVYTPTAFIPKVFIL